MPLMLDRRLFTQFDWVLFALILLLPLISLVVLYSAGYNPDSEGFSLLGIEIKSYVFIKQSFFYMMGIAILFLSLFFNPLTLERFSYVIYGVCIVLLVAVMVIGTNTNGSQRWLAISGFRFQPSEIMKIAIILCMARYCSKNPPGPEGYTFSSLFAPALLVGVPFLLVLQQPDLGTGLSVLIIGASIILFSGVQLKTLVILVTGTLLSFIPAWFWILKLYQKQRIITMLNPEADPFGSGYHIIQSKIAVGSGSFFGKGYLQGTQSQLEFLPEHTTDFIFSVLAEEWGFIGSAVVILLYFALTQRMLSVAQRSRDNFSMLFVVGSAVMLFFHVMVNIGMVLGLMPVVGIPLPLFSYGGTAAMTNFLIFGLVLGVGMRRFMFKGYDKFPVVLLIFSSIFFASRVNVFAEEKPKDLPSEYFELKVKPEYYEGLISAINQGKEFKHPQKKAETEFEYYGQPWHEWLKNDIMTELALDRTELVFETTEQIENLASGTTFSTAVKFEDSEYLLRQNKLQINAGDLDNARRQKSFNILFDSNSKIRKIMGNNYGVQLHIFIPHKDKFGFVLFIPSTHKIDSEVESTNLRGLVMCPRVISVTHIKSSLPTLIDAPVKLNTVSSQASGLIKAKVNTGFGQGLAEAEILTTKNIQPGKVARDISTNLFPYVQLKYLPQSTKVDPVLFQNETGIGIRSRIVLHNSLNHLSEIKIEMGVGIKEFTLTQHKPIKINDRQFIVDTGTCYAIVFSLNPTGTFKKELLKHSIDPKKDLEEMVEVFSAK